MPIPRNHRKNARTQVVKPTRIQLKGKLFQVCNISNDGIGIVLDDEAIRFFVGERIEKIPIPLKNRTICVKGIVSHISKTSQNRICGIQFLSDSDTFSAIVQFRRENTHPPPG